MSDQPETHFRCPTCRAVQDRAEVCRRCKCDLRLVLAAQDAARAARRQALSRLAAGRPHAALVAAQELLLLERTADSLQLAAVCALLAGDYHAALAAANCTPAETPLA
jgi:hypothetical protein